MHQLLLHFEAVGCALTPRFLGLSAEGLERLSFFEGSTGSPPLSDAVRSDSALVSVARAVRSVHDASVGFVPSPDAVWQSYEIARPSSYDCFGHHDLAPWNFVFDGAEVRGIIDWDTAGPSNRVWDLAYAAHQFVPFHPTPDLASWGWSAEPDRAARLRLFLSAYGLGVAAAAVVDAAVVRLASMGAFIAGEVAAGNPAFAVHAREDHAAGYLGAAAWIAGQRSVLL